MDLSLPDLLRASGDPRLREYLRGRTPRQFAIGVAMTDAVSRAVQKAAHQHGMDNQEVLEALVTALVSAVQRMAPVEQWKAVGVTLAEQVLRRLMVSQN